MKRIEGRARTVRELLDAAKYTIDFYQREYAWQERQVRELVDDLTGKFLDFYEYDHARHEVESYGHYFLGSIVISHKRGKAARHYEVRFPAWSPQLGSDSGQFLGVWRGTRGDSTTTGAFHRGWRTGRSGWAGEEDTRTHAAAAMSGPATLAGVMVLEGQGVFWRRSSRCWRGCVGR